MAAAHCAAVAVQVLTGMKLPVASEERAVDDPVHSWEIPAGVIEICKVENLVLLNRSADTATDCLPMLR